jgi:ABC-type phosphate transport system substrate-binding protein
LGIFGYSFLYENQDTLKAVKVEGVEPNFDTIADGSYKIARPDLRLREERAPLNRKSMNRYIN